MGHCIIYTKTSFLLFSRGVYSSDSGLLNHKSDAPISRIFISNEILIYLENSSDNAQSIFVGKR